MLVLTKNYLLNLPPLTIYLFLFICFNLRMALPSILRLAIGASNCTYFICKALISLCHLSIIAYLRVDFHYSLSQYPLFFDCLKGNSSLSSDKKLFLLRRYLRPLRKNAFNFEQDSFCSWIETLFPRNKTIIMGIKTILLYLNCFLLNLKCFSLHTITFLLRVECFLLGWKTFLLSLKCLWLESYTACLRENISCLSQKHFDQEIFYVCSSEKHLRRSQKHFVVSKIVFSLMMILFIQSKKVFI